MCCYCSGVTGGSVLTVPPWHFSEGNFCWHTRKIESKEKRGNGGQNNKNCEREGGKLKMEGEEVWNCAEDLFFFFFFFFFFFCFSLFKTTEICLERNTMEISTRKRIFHAGKKSGKVTLPPLKNIPLTPLYYWHCAGVCIDYIATFNILWLYCHL